MIVTVCYLLLALSALPHIAPLVTFNDPAKILGAERARVWLQIIGILEMEHK